MVIDWIYHLSFILRQPCSKVSSGGPLKMMRRPGLAHGPWVWHINIENSSFLVLYQFWSRFFQHFWKQFFWCSQSLRNMPNIYKSVGFGELWALTSVSGKLTLQPRATRLNGLWIIATCCGCAQQTCVCGSDCWVCSLVNQKPNLWSPCADSAHVTTCMSSSYCWPVHQPRQDHVQWKDRR